MSTACVYVCVKMSKRTRTLGEQVHAIIDRLRDADGAAEALCAPFQSTVRARESR